MTKRDIARSIRGPLTVQQTEWIIDDFMTAIKNAVQSGKDVQLRGFRCFTSVVRKAKVSNLPTVGKNRIIPEQRKVKFYPGKQFKA